MVEFSPAYSIDGADSKLIEVRLRQETSPVRRKRLLPPTIPTLPLRRTSPKRVVKTYFVGIIQPTGPGKSGRARTNPQKAVESTQCTQTCEESAEIENRIAYRTERASRYASQGAFPVLASKEIMPEWCGESPPESPKSSKESPKSAKSPDSPPSSLGKPTLVFLRRKKTVELDKESSESSGKKSAKPWKAGSKAPAPHPVYMSSAPSPRAPKNLPRPREDRRKSLTTLEFESFQKREQGRKKAEELNERVLSSVRRNSTQSVSLAEFNEKIRKAGEASRAKNFPELEDESQNEENVGGDSDVLADLPHFDFVNRLHSP
eukprot:Skav226528  [mRNA]  locus=scaffold1773:262916:263872:- [translate_table: standard]